MEIDDRRLKSKRLRAASGIATCLILAAVTSPAAAAAQERAKSLTINRVAAPPKIDGQIGDACWVGLEPATGFFQYDPLNGEKASEETLVWAAYDQNYIYFAFLMKDSRPDRIWAELTPRNEYENNDSITVVLDAYNDRRTSVSFTLNPRGVQKNSFDTIWKSGAVIRSDGWSAEMAIPFKSLRFSPAEAQVWGVNFERFIHRLNETDTWTHVSRDLPKLQQMGELQGLKGVKPGHNLEFFPYAGVRTTRWDGTKDDKVAAGVDVKYGIRSNLYLDMTVSPDFSEVESDPFLYQLSPYEVYISERRPFFSEGRQYFRLATERGYSWASDISLFYSRRIDNPRFATKLSGKTGGYSFGLLGAVNAPEVGSDEGASRFGVVRIQKDIFKNSQVGIFYTGLDEKTGANQNFALDFNFNFKDFYYLRGASVFSLTEGQAKKDNFMHILQFSREPDAGFQLNFNFQRVEKNVSLRAGYLNRVDWQTTEAAAGYAWRYSSGLIKKLSFDLTGTLDQDTSGNRTGEELEFMVFTDFFNRIELHGGFSAGRRQYQVRDDSGQIVWNGSFLRTYGWNLDFDWEKGGFLRDVSLETSWERRGVYNEDFTAVVPGRQFSVEGSLDLSPRSNIILTFGADWIRQTLAGTGETAFEGLTYETGIHFQMTRRFFLSARLLGETREDQYSFDFLAGYEFGAGNIVQLSYKKSERREDIVQEAGHSFTLKLSYLLRI